MAKNFTDKKNNGKYTSNETKPKTVTCHIPFICSGVDGKREYHVDTAFDLIKSIADLGIFDRLSVDVKMAKSVAFNIENAKGQVPVARLRNYDSENQNVTILFFGRNVDIADKVTDKTVLIPHVLTDKEGNVETFIGFELVDV